jgi:hypothetical protein
MSTRLSEDQFGDLLRSFEQQAFRLELQPAYSEPMEAATLARFHAGQPEPPTEVPGLKAWFDQVAALTAAGKHIQRVRVHEDPPTQYQQWERWIGQWNIAAGETLRYMTRSEAISAGLLPSAGTLDWWLPDSRRLITMTFDDQGRRIWNELVEEPNAVRQACARRDPAIRHSAPEPSGRAS